MKRVFAVLLCLALVACLLPLHAVAVTTIENVVLTLQYPEAGKAPTEAAWYGQGYSVYDTEWYDWSDDRYLEPSDKIQVGHQYEVTIWVEADSGYAFKAVNDNTPDITATVNGESMEVSKAYEYKAWAMVTVTYYFSSVPSKGWINLVELTVPAPATGARPFFDKIETASYHLGNVYFSGNTDPNMKNGISWYNATNSEQINPNNGETFAPRTPYMFHCLVFPNEGYKITADARVRVNGQPAEAMLDYDTFLSVKYTFPATAALGPKPDLHAHTPGSPQHSATEHYRYCTGCGEIVEREAHKGGKATCVAKGECTVCGYAYLPENEDHIPDTKWTACAGLYHAKLCTRCGAHCTPEGHEPGPAATETSPQTCKVCGYILAPTKNHTHKLSKVEAVPATCLKAGVKEHYACSGCSDLFSDAKGKNKIQNANALVQPMLKHAYADKWEHSETEHWMVCKHCKEPMPETRMKHNLQNGKCSLCGYAAGVAQTTTTGVAQTTTGGADGDPTSTTGKTDETGTPTTDAPSSTQKDPVKGGGNRWLVPVIIGAAVFAAAIVTAVLILKKKKS